MEHFHIQRRQWLQVGALATGSALLGAPAWARTDYPTKPIKLIVPFNPGGATDIVARSIGEKLATRMGQPVLVDNRAGGSGVTGTDFALKSAPDGYTFLISLGTTMLINQFLYSKLPYHPQRDQALMTQIALAPVTLLVNPKLQVNNATELWSHITRNKGKLSYGSWGSGSYSHLACAWISHNLQADMTHTPYKGEAPMMQDLAGGQIDMAFASLQAAKPHIDSGRVKVIAVTGEQRMAALPQAATLIEQGIKDEIFRISGWLGMSAPARTPTEVLQQVTAEVRAIITLPEIRQRIQTMGFIPVGNTSEQFAAVIQKDAPIWERVVKLSGAKLD